MNDVPRIDTSQNKLDWILSKMVIRLQLYEKVNLKEN